MLYTVLCRRKLCSLLICIYLMASVSQLHCILSIFRIVELFEKGPLCVMSPSDTVLTNSTFCSNTAGHFEAAIIKTFTVTMGHGTTCVKGVTRRDFVEFLMEEQSCGSLEMLSSVLFSYAAGSLFQQKGQNQHIGHHHVKEK